MDVSDRVAAVPWNERDAIRLVPDLHDAISLRQSARSILPPDTMRGSKTNLRCAMQAGGSIARWAGQERDPATVPSPMLLREVAGVSDAGQIVIAALPQDNFACVRCRGGGVECISERGRRPVPGPDDAVAIAGARHHVCAVRASGRAACFGSDGSGALGGSMVHVVGDIRR